MQVYLRGNQGEALMVIALMLLVVYRSLVTMLIMLVTVLIELAAARGVVAVLANSGVIRPFHFPPIRRIC